MNIIEIEEFTKAKYKIIFEDCSYIVLYKKDLQRYHLSEGVELDIRQFRVLMEEILPHRAKTRCMKLLQSKDYTEGEIRKKLQGDGYPQSVIDTAVEYLYGYHYLDDERYVKLYYQSRCMRKSRKQIILDLQQKGIAKEIILRVMEQNKSEESDADELQCIRKLLWKKKYNDSEATLELKEKVKVYLFRKGFEINDINFCMRDFSWENM